MIANFTKQLLSWTLSILPIIASTPLENRAPQTGSAGYSGQGVPLSAEELQQLAAPIAFYPDSLVVQIFAEDNRSECTSEEARTIAHANHEEGREGCGWTEEAHS